MYIYIYIPRIQEYVRLRNIKMERGRNAGKNNELRMLAKAWWCGARNAAGKAVVTAHP